MKAVNVDDVLKILHKYGKYIFMTDEYIFVTDEKRYSSMVDEIANLKTLKQEPKTGHWIKHNAKCYECSECHNAKSLYAGYETDYCHDCGAKMIEPQESEEV